MPLNPNIPLGAEPIKFNDPFAVLQAYRNQAQENEYRQQQIRSQQALEEERRRKTEEERQQSQAAAMKSTAISDALRKAYDPKTKKVDPTKFSEVLISQGLGEDAIGPIVKGLYENETHAEAARKAKTDAEEAELRYAKSAGAQMIAANFHPVIVDAYLTKAELDGHDMTPFRQMLDQDPEQFKTFVNRLVNPEKPAEDYTLGDTRYKGGTNQVLATNPKEATPPTDYTLGNTRYQGGTNKPLVTAPSESTADQRNKTWIMRGQQPMFVLPSEVRPGDTPYDRTRTGLRPMLSSDANRVADFDNALGLMAELKPQIEGTGAGSWLGSLVPTSVTDLTGVGMDSKIRQGIIDKAKQVIGKTLEGGVLRKEDEVKYAKILPTIADPPALAKSKIDGLIATVTQQRENLLSSLGDAGFDVERSQQRKASGGAKVRMMAPNGQVKEVDESEVDHYKRMGAKIMGGR